MSFLGRFIDVCDAIAYAHSRGVLHRDLKPGNIMLGKYGETLVVDWGLAKALDQSEPESPADRSELPLTPLSGSAPGADHGRIGDRHPGYMSPEQAAGRLDQLGPRSDVYCLGATLYHLLTGHAPCEAEEIGEVFGRSWRATSPGRGAQPSNRAGLGGDLPEGDGTRPEDRYDSAEALRADLERWLADEPVSALQSRYKCGCGGGRRRNRVAVMGAVATLIVGLIGLAAVAIVQARANGQLRDANNGTQTGPVEVGGVASKAEAVREFLVGAFRSPDPSEDGRLIKVADVLDQATEKLERGFRGSDATKGAFLNALGETYEGLGLYDKAQTLHSKARGLPGVRARTRTPRHAGKP